MNADLAFSYRYVYVPPIGRIFYPLITIGLETVDKGLVDFEFIVDTGADLTTIPFFMAKRLGLDLSKSRKSQSQGIGGIMVDTWITRLPLYIQKMRFVVRVSVTADNKTPFLLGRVDMLDFVFSWNFDSRRKEIIFTRLKST